ncbi:transglycosylase SLT domain-containing protein [Nocardia sp. NPDC023852]|uniref:transglycosylase SLT domain-containing protein n=1 Tax=Nocardia sp. NPDC023852 TaxID=3154697 RepID=UPI0033C10AB3
MSPPTSGRWVVKLHHPDGERPGLKAVIEVAEQTIQTSADLLATGTPSQAPDLVKLLSDDKLVDDQNNSVMAEDYSTRLKEVRDIKDDIRKQGDNVDLSAYGAYDISSSTFSAIIRRVDMLDTRLREAPGPSPGKQYMPPHIESGLTTAVLKTLIDVHTEIEQASDRVQSHAKNIADAAPTYTPVPGSSGGNPMPSNYVPSNYVPSNYMQRSYTPHEGFVPSATTADYARYQGNVSVDAAIEGALDALGITDPVARENWKRGYRVLIERESNGNPNAVNNWDSNAAAGKASRGLTQTIPGTFQANHVAGTSTNIHDPVANVAASMKYVMERYNVSRDGHDLQAKVQQTDPSRPAKGY